MDNVRATTYTFGIFFTPNFVNQAILIKNSFSYDLCGKFFASGAVLEGAILLKFFDLVGNL